MKWWPKITRLLNKPFPEEESLWAYFRNLSLISLFIAFFLYIFQPFGLASLESGKLLICLGFGLMTFLASVLFEFTISRLLKLKGPGLHFTFGKWMLYMIGVMLIISLANFLYARLLFFGDIRWAFFPQMVYGTFMVGFFPIVMVGTLALLWQEQKYQTIADEVSKKQAKASTSRQTKLPLIFDIPIDQIRYVEALQNYVRIRYLGPDGHAEEQTERATLKRILEETKHTPIVQCHRSYLVNREAIISVSGNAQGLLLRLSDCDKEVPVSRSFISIFRDH